MNMLVIENKLVSWFGFDWFWFVILFVYMLGKLGLVVLN